MRGLIRFSLLAPLGLALIACDDGDAQQPQPVQSRVALEAFDSCSALEGYIEDTAVQQMRVALESYKRDQYWGGGILAGAEDGAMAPNAGNNRSQDAAPDAHTRTNTQVQGVDEADFMKTDGTRIFVIADNDLYVARSWPPESLALASRLEIEGWPREMFLNEDDGTVVVFSNWYPDVGNDPYPYWCQWGCYYGGMTKVTVIDASDARNLRITNELFLPGGYANSRRIGDSVRVVLRDHVMMPEGVRYWPESFRGDWQEDRDELYAAIDQQIAENERLIRSQSLDFWLPQGFRRAADGTETPIARRCGDFHRSNAPVRLGIASIATVDLGQGPAALDMTSILGEVGEVYASTESLYIASPHWWWWPSAGQTSHTYLHKFDITDPSRAVYVGSGGVAGTVLNQFSMDEHNGFFRVATTVDRWIADRSNGWWGRRETTNRVTVLAENAGRLVAVGRTRELAEDERITSARFMGNKGYLVTFEQIDPLFTVDLSNPAAPRIVGELKIPGFSSYLHPLDDDHILAIGTYLPEPDANGRVDWSERRMKLNIFDVSNFAQPTQTFETVVGTAYGWSEANWEHKAFNYFPEKKMLAVPFADWSPRDTGEDYWERLTTELKLFHVDVNTGIDPRGAIRMDDLYRRVDYREWTWYYTPWVRRSVMASDSELGDYAYAISDAGIRVAPLDAPAAPVADVLFDSVERR